jgi:ribonuclease P protein component
MLCDKHRLRKQKDIKLAQKEGRSGSFGELRIKAVFNKLGATRFCFIVPAAVEARAAGRNLIKRRLREAARSLLPRIGGSYDIVVWLRNKPQDASFAKLFAALEKNLALAKILTDKL